MADKKTKKKLAKKKARPRVLKKVARRIRDRATWFDARMKDEERDLWRFTVIASCIHGDAKIAIETGDKAVKAFRTRFRPGR